MPALDGIILRQPAAGAGLALPQGGLQPLRFTTLLRAMMAFHAALLDARSRLRADVPVQFPLHGMALAPGAELPSMPEPDAMTDAVPGLAAGPAPGLASGPGLGLAPEAAVPAVPDVVRARVAAIAAGLEELLQVQRDAARRLSDRQAALLRDAQYVMCALADDMLLHDEAWEARLLWRDELLENRMFGTRIAGERFFDRADRIAALAERDGQELAPVYLLALCLGFRGRHRGPDGESTLRRHAKALFEVATGRPPDPQMHARAVAPLAIASVLGGESALRRPRGFGWPAIAGAVLAGFAVLSTALWFVLTAPLWHAAEQVFQAAR